MMRTERYRKFLIAASAFAALAVVPYAAHAANEECPAPVPNHVPDAPQPPLNLGPIKKLLLDYHADHYSDDVAAVFESAKKFIEQHAVHAKRPALVMDIDETSLT